MPGLFMTARHISDARSFGDTHLPLALSLVPRIPSSPRRQKMASSVSTVTEGADAAGGALGVFGRQTIEHLGDYMQPPFSRCALFGFPIDSPVIDNLVRFVDG